MVSSFAEHFAGSLIRYTKHIRVNRIARKGIKKTTGIRQVHPPMMDAETNRSGGLSQLFHKLSRARPSMT